MKLGFGRLLAQGRDTALRPFPFPLMHQTYPPTGTCTQFKFDHSFGPADGNELVYACTTLPLVRAAVLEGRIATVFAYGQTASGQNDPSFSVSSAIDGRRACMD